MSNSANNIWFSLLHSRPYKGVESAFPDISQIRGIKELEEQSVMIYNELEDYLKKNELESQFNSTMVESPKTWKVRSLRVWGVEMYDVQKYFPQTLKLLLGIDGVINIGFNLLEPNAVIKPHCGDTNAVIRCHLGLQIPEESEYCAIKVNTEIRCWKQGKVIGFMDAYDHEAWNRTDKKRIILLFDILKPEFFSQKNKICGVVISSLYIQQIANYIPQLYKVNPVILYPITYPLSFLIRVLIPFRNYLKK